MGFDFENIPTSLARFQDDPSSTDSHDTIQYDHAVWQWSTCCTDGGGFSGFPLDTCLSFTITITRISGIRSWLLISGNRDTLIPLDTSKTLELGYAIDTPYFAYDLGSSTVVCDDTVSVLITNPLCTEMLFDVSITDDTFSVIYDSIVAVPDGADSFEVTFTGVPPEAKHILTNPLLPCIPGDTLDLSVGCCFDYFTKFICPQQDECFSLVSCRDQTISIELALLLGDSLVFTDQIDTTRIYFTLGIQHPDTTTETIPLQSDCGCFNFVPGDTMTVIFHSGCDLLDTLINDGDMVILQLDSLITKNGCEINFR